MWARRLPLLTALAAAACAQAQLRSRAVEIRPRAIEQQIYVLVNEERRKHGAVELSWDDQLASEARHHSFNMVARWFFAHDDPVRGDLGKRLRGDKILWHFCAENIFSEQGYPDPARAAVEGWLKSPGHRANMLSPRLLRTGVGVSQRADGVVFITQDFIRP
jgi:uncharacterized protein YkwD